MKDKVLKILDIMKKGLGYLLIGISAVVIYIFDKVLDLGEYLIK